VNKNNKLIDNKGITFIHILLFKVILIYYFRMKSQGNIIDRVNNMLRDFIYGK